jgi:hypothetical protein
VDAAVSADIREAIRHQAEETASRHQPDSVSGMFCQTCGTAYPCGPKWMADRALDAFDHRHDSAYKLPARPSTGQPDNGSAE